MSEYLGMDGGAGESVARDIVDGLHRGAVLLYNLRPDNVIWLQRTVNPLWVEMTGREFEQITDGVSWCLEWRRPAVIVNADAGLVR